MIIPNLETVAALIREAAETEVLPRFRELKPDEIATKTSPNDLVTAADLACEAFLSARFRELTPGAMVVGEEAAAKDTRLLDALHGDDPVWIIDPVDGTWNFAHGDDRFVIIVALVHRGEILAGWIYRPITQVMVTASLGDGVFCAGQRLSVAPCAEISAMNAVLYVGPRRTPELHARVKELRPRLGKLVFQRSAGAEYLELLFGRVHYAIFTKQLPWDHAAGCLMVREAGGFLANLDDTPYHPSGSEKSLLMAPDEDCWRMLRDLFTGVREEGDL